MGADEGKRAAKMRQPPLLPYSVRGTEYVVGILPSAVPLLIPMICDARLKHDNTIAWLVNSTTSAS